ncbi:unnamed protein product [Nesidiocoris tenuis]|uniref:Uncharacterized protein n=1 Tax=Nesidiocoris tenuis TaxID=355587 RepID=A0A6H5FTD8_9HEMI|nr:unnamed protein product [Nesidiocoris tenuis]
MGPPGGMSAAPRAAGSLSAAGRIGRMAPQSTADHLPPSTSAELYGISAEQKIRRPIVPEKRMTT